MQVCGECDREDRMLLCDGCDLGYHLECLDPPMETVPLDEWFCPDCIQLNSSHVAEEVIKNNFNKVMNLHFLSVCLVIYASF